MTSPKPDHVSLAERLPGLEKRAFLRQLLLCLTVIAAYLLLCRPEVIVESQIGFTMWFPAIGLIFAVLLGLSPWYFPLAVFAEAFAEVVLYHQPITSWSVLAAPLLVCSSYTGAAALLRGPLKIDSCLRQRQDVLRYLSVALAAAVVATVSGVACVSADHNFAWKESWRSSLGWYIGDLVGLVGFAPFLLIHVLPWVRRSLSPHDASPIQKPNWLDAIGDRIRTRGVLEAIGQFSGIAFVLWVMFSPKLGHSQFYYLAFVPIIWIAMRQGIHRVVTGLITFNFGVVFALKLYPMSADSPLKISLLMLALSSTGLLVGAVVAERYRIANQLQERTGFLNSLIEHNPLGIVIHDRAGRVQLCNQAFVDLFRYSREELIGHLLDPLISTPEEAADAHDLTLQATSGAALHTVVNRRRKDGTTVDLDLHAVTISLDGQADRAYAIYQDISDQVNATQRTLQHSDSLNRLVNELQLHTAQMTLLNEMGELLQCSANSAEAHSVVAQVAKRLFRDSTGGSLFVFKSSRNLLESVAHWGSSQSSYLAFAPDACWSLRRGQPYWSEQPNGVVICSHLKGPVPANHLCVPLVAQGDTLGVLTIHYDVASGRTGNESFENWHDAQRRLAVAVGGRVALSLAGLMLRETLRDQSIRDSLTGLFNRRFMEDFLTRELQRAKRKKHPLVVVFVDLDHFKRFNDIHGHDAGDAVLRSIAELFQQHFRGDDVICRYGGEEFAFILPESSTVKAVQRLEDLRKAARGHRIPYHDLTLESVTFSMGVAAYPENGSTCETLLQAADHCLYESKADGRDRITVAAPQALLPVS